MSFSGSNLRATHNLAHNVAKIINQASLSEPSVSVSRAAHSELDFVHQEIFEPGDVEVQSSLSKFG